ncbi:MAG: tetratricopeptide repeat protein, partial [Balneolaceae bacterium]|nr:tetratricopeptide repeat protein [Balneolaceae bacterium]
MTASNRNLVTGFLILFLVTLFPVPVLSQDSPEPVNQHYKQGINLFEEGQYRKAAAELERFGELHPNHELLPSAWYYRARALGYADSTNRRAHYESFIRSYPNTVFSQKLLFELGQSAEESGNHRGAISYYERSLSHKLKPAKAAEVYFWMAEAAVSAGDTDQARHYFLTLADRYPESPWAPKALYSRGRLYLNEGQFDASSKAFELLKERYPNHDMTRRIGTALGESYYQQRKFPEAIEAFKNAMPYLDEELSAKATYLIAESYNYLNQFDEASRYYLQYINMKKGSERVRIAHYGLGWVYHKQEIYHWAAESFGKAAEGEDELARKALYYKAVNEKLGGRYADAIETFREFGNRYREGLWIEQAYYEWAVTAYEMGIYEESVEVLLDLVRMEQKLQWEGNVYTLLGEAYFASKEYTRALQAFEEAEKLTDIDPEVKRQARFHKAWMQHQNQAYRQAQPVFESIYDEAPDSELGKKALFWSADAHYNLRQYGPASRQFGVFVERYSGHELTGAAHYSLGWSYFNLGDYANAIEPFETFLNNYEAPSIALYPYDTDTQLRLGDSYYAMGRYDEAIGAYEMAIGAEPGGDYAMFQIANCHYRDEETYEAVTTFRRFLRIYPFSRLREQAQYNIAYIYLNTGNYTQAIEEFQKVINKYPNTNWAARSQYNIGDAYYNAGEYDRAVSAYNAVLQKYPSSSYIIEAVNGIQYAQLSAGEADSSSAILEEFLADHPRTSMADRLRFRKAEDLMQSGDYMSAIDAFRQYIRISNNQQLLP